MGPEQQRGGPTVPPPGMVVLQVVWSPLRKLDRCLFSLVLRSLDGLEASVCTLYHSHQSAWKAQ